MRSPTVIFVVLIALALGGWGLSVFLTEGSSPPPTPLETPAPSAPQFEAPVDPQDFFGPPPPIPVSRQQERELAASEVEAEVGDGDAAEAVDEGEVWVPWRIEGRVRGLRPESPWTSPLTLEFHPRGSSLLFIREWSFDVGEEGRYAIDLPLFVAAACTSGPRLILRGDQDNYTVGETRLEIDPDGAWRPRTLRMDLKVSLAAGVSGFVTGPTGRPLSGAGVALFELSGGEVKSPAVTTGESAADGSYLLRAPRESNFLVVAFAPLPQKADGKKADAKQTSSASATMQDLLRLMRSGSAVSSDRFRRSHSARVLPPSALLLDPTLSSSVSPATDLRPSARRCSASPGQRVEAPTLQMKKGARLSGTVRVEEVGPLAGVVVVARQLAPEGVALEADGAPRMQYANGEAEYFYRHARSDERGEWEILALATGPRFDVHLADLPGTAFGSTRKRARRLAFAPGEGLHLILSGAVVDIQVRGGRGQDLQADLLLQQDDRARREKTRGGQGISFLAEPGRPLVVEARAPYYQDTRVVLQIPRAGEFTQAVLIMKRVERRSALKVEVRAAQEPPSSVTYLLASQDPELSDLSGVATLVDGSFVIDEVPLGRWRLHLSPATEPGLSGNIPSSSLFHPVASPVVIDGIFPQQEISLRVRSAGALRVRVFDSEGNPTRAQVWIGMTPNQGRWLDRSAGPGRDAIDLVRVAQARGLEFAVNGVAVAPSLLLPARYPLRVTAEDFGWKGEVEIRAGQIADQRVDFGKR